MFMVLDSIVTFIGFISITLLTSIVLTRIVIAISQNLRQQVQLCGGPNAWAVVTGATDGIGLEYAKQLAQKGYNLLLLSRNQEKLNSVKEEIESQTNCKIRVLDVDFHFRDIYYQIKHELDQLEEIHILVNNVGMGSPKSFTEMDPDYLSDLINVNIISCTQMTHLILPKMEAKGKGAIINISSSAAISPVPLLTVYSATKAYVDYMSRALSKEYESKGITIQSVLPFYVSTKLTTDYEPNALSLSPEKYVSNSLKTICKVNRTSGYNRHNIFYFILELFNILSILTGCDINVNLAFLNLKRLIKPKQKK